MQAHPRCEEWEVDLQLDIMNAREAAMTRGEITDEEQKKVIEHILEDAMHQCILRMHKDLNEIVPRVIAQQERQKPLPTRHQQPPPWVTPAGYQKRAKIERRIERSKQMAVIEDFDTEQQARIDFRHRKLARHPRKQIPVEEPKGTMQECDLCRAIEEDLNVCPGCHMGRCKRCLSNEKDCECKFVRSRETMKNLRRLAFPPIQIPQ